MCIYMGVCGSSGLCDLVGWENLRVFTCVYGGSVGVCGGGGTVVEGTMEGVGVQYNHTLFCFHWL